MINISSTNQITRYRDLNNIAYQELLKTSDVLSSVPNNDAELLYRTRTYHFINQSQSLSKYDSVSIEQIFYRLGALKILDPTLSNVSSSKLNYWINQTLLFQNINGGFGNWQYDRTGVFETNKATKIFNWSNYIGMNKTLISNYLENNRNSLTGGYNTHIYDRDSDIFSTFLAMDAYKHLSLELISPSILEDVLVRAQNPDGGFGLQTNNIKGIFWTSTIEATWAAIMGLQMLNSSGADLSNAVSFLKGLQTLNGGYVNFADVNQIPTGYYTALALEAIYERGSTPLNTTKAIEFLLSLENPDGGFKVKTSSPTSSLQGTYYAVKGLSLLGSTPTNISKTIDFILNGLILKGGFGKNPGAIPTLRYTFDAVSALKLRNGDISNQQDIKTFIGTYRNGDGGYGLIQSSVESTFLALEIYHLLGEIVPNTSETVNYIRSLQAPDGGFKKSASELNTYVVSTYRAIRALELLNSEPLDKNNAITYIRNLQNTDGGFGGYLGDTSDVTSTYRAIRALSILGSSPNDITSAIAFIRNSQNVDGGFKRSIWDYTLPKNVSNIIHSYSAARALLILDSYPLNAHNLYYFIKSVRNNDGGFAEHRHFTSDVAYTFVSMWLLKNFNNISRFSIELPDTLDKPRFHSFNFPILVKGGVGPYQYTLSYLDTNNLITTGTKNYAGTLIIDTITIPDGTYSLNFTIIDFFGAKIEILFNLRINHTEFAIYMSLISGSIIIGIIIFLKLRKRRNIA
ncbi:MAG: prenyltransferase/squalene oxidase repeat-containing protein [Candidatus Odinarchaeota archaeon]